MRARLATHAPPQIVKTAAYLCRDAPSSEEEEQSLEMDTLKFLTASIPDWQRRLEDFDEQIDQRQKDLARLNEVQDAEASGSGTKSLRPKGSTESLKARDDGDAHPREVARDVMPMDIDDDDPEKKAAAAAGAAAARFDTSAQQPADPQTQQQPQVQQQQSNTQTPPSPTDSHAQRQANAARAAGQARARATLKKRQRTDSLLSQPRDEDYKPKYRSRSMIIVYYDSYVQIFFEELVKFVSSARNTMRKAKMAAKVAKIRRQAELDVTDADGSKKLNAASNNAGNSNPTTANATTPCDGPIEPAENPNDPAAILPVLAFRSKRRMGSSAAAFINAARSGRPLYGQAARLVTAMDPQNDEPTVWDELDKGLEYVQGMSEHAAHQFLRDGECAEEVLNIKRRLEEVLELAQREMERMEKEDANGNKQEGANGEDDLTRARSYRLQSMRKAVVGKDKDSIPLPPLPTPILPETHDMPPAAKPAQPEDEGVEA